MQNERKLNWLHQNLAEGLVVDSSWLKSKGYSSALRSQYQKSGWLELLAHGVYRRPPGKDGDRKVRWQHVVISLQTLLAQAIAVGGRTALELQGLGHYLSQSGPREIHLYGDNAPPGWLKRVPLETPFVFHNASRLFAPQAEVIGLTEQSWGHWNWMLRMSTPERAILEVLNELPQHETFHQSDVLMEGLSNLSPRLLQVLLECCRSVKVKRLFLWFAERHGHAWLKRLSLKNVDLGKGKRMLVKGGKLDTKFNITVPETLDGDL